ncbi:hypothetical protein H0H81_011210 [Sphagnurus paluster]|uniref:Carbohydrate kinase PfkB domain-containing protein n=1 Tax=Sphagnurus paluster TaxID=117069 RepID=A0A9P7FYG5_9AGAR|nr:hypothetical protein H0H81_011210 [Sphagnurus paluster]
MSLGGVARNVAEASHRVISCHASQLSSLLVAPIGDDAFGRLLYEETAQLGMRVDGLVKTQKRTAVCNMVLDSHGGLVGGVADMDITAAMEGPNVAEPTSVIKSTRIIPAVAASLNVTTTKLAPISFCSPNSLELAQLFHSAEALDLTSHPAWWRVMDSLSLGSAFRSDLEQLARRKVCDADSSKGTLSFLIEEGVAQMAVKLLPFFQHLTVKCGEQGVVVVMRLSGTEAARSLWAGGRSDTSQRSIIAHGHSNDVVILQHFPPHPVDEVINVTGAGDSFVGALLANLLQYPDTFLNPERLRNTMFSAQNAAILSLQSPYAVSPLLSGVQ